MYSENRPILLTQAFSLSSLSLSLVSSRLESAPQLCLFSAPHDTHVTVTTGGKMDLWGLDIAKIDWRP
jgi:hypothetical protein